MSIFTSYLRKVYDPDIFELLVPRVIDKAVEAMVKCPFDAIAFTGTSGAALAYILSWKLKVPLLCVRGG